MLDTVDESVWEFVGIVHLLLCCAGKQPAEAEVAAIHLNAKEAVAIRQYLEEMGHPQPATRIRTDNAAAQGFVNGTIKQNRGSEQIYLRKEKTNKEREYKMRFRSL